MVVTSRRTDGTNRFHFGSYGTCYDVTRSRGIHLQLEATMNDDFESIRIR